MPLSRSVFSFFFPGGFLVAATVLLLRSEAAPTLRILHGFAILIYAAAALLAWRFHSSRILLAAALLAIADAGLRHGAGDAATAAAAHDLAAVLLPANLIALAFVEERGLFSRNTAIHAGAIGAQVALASVLCRPEMQAASLLEFSFLPAQSMQWSPVPQASFLIFAAGALFFVARFALLRNPVESGFFWGLVACFLSFTATPGVYLMSAGLVLAVGVVENSYLMAYHDQLTGLPARRAFYRTVANPRALYVIALADVDHFKKFNDTYGHDIGDQVLRMVAARLARVTGGGKAFRWGGEEFAIFFPGKTAADTVEHLELLRELVETSTFIVRGRDRRKRGPDDRGRAPRAPAQEVWVTISLGVADGAADDDLHKVMEAADAALYRAKAAGRNRLEIAGASRPKPASMPRESVPTG